MLTFVLWAAPVHPALAADWHVDDGNQTGVEDGSVLRPYRSIQTAIARSASGDTIKVAIGTYVPITTLGKSLNLLGGYPGQSPPAYAGGLGGDFSAQGPATSATIIDGGGTQAADGVTFTRFDDQPYHATLDNFTVRKSRKGIVCDTEVSYPHPSNVTVSRNIVEDNGTQVAAGQEDSQGGGIIVTGSAGDDVLVRGNIIRRNYGGRGAGVTRRGDSLAKLRITGNRIEDNVMQADHGGAVYVYGDVVLENNIITSNRQAFAYGWGGGVVMFNVGTLHSSGNVIAYNHAVSQGGGIFVDDGASAVMRNDLIHHNTTASGMAGGILVDDGIADGVPVSSSIQLVNCTVAYNNVGVPPADPFNDLGGNGIYLDGRNALSSATVTNCIFWGNRDDFYGQEDHFALAVTHSLSAESVAGTGNIIGQNPLFSNAPTANFTLLAGSPCIDAGNNQPWAGIPEATDLNNQPRIANGTVDMGALEFAGSATPYSIWAVGYGLSGNGALPASDPDGDRFDNMTEFAFGTNPAIGNPSPLTTSSSGGQFVATFLQRTDGSLIYRVQSTDNLATNALGDDTTVTASITDGPALPAPPTGYVRRQFSVLATGRKFFRICAIGGVGQRRGEEVRAEAAHAPVTPGSHSRHHYGRRSGDCPWHFAGCRPCRAQAGEYLDRQPAGENTSGEQTRQAGHPCDRASGN